MIYIIGLYISLTVLYSIFVKNNTYNSFLNGVKEGTKIVINMFSILLTFTVVVKCIENCGIIDYLNIFFDNAGMINVLLQMLVRPLSSGSSYAIMTNIFNLYGVNSFYGFLSSFIHASCDTLFYIVAVYYSYASSKNSNKALTYGLIVIIFSYLLSFIISLLFFK